MIVLLPLVREGSSKVNYDVWIWNKGLRKYVKVAECVSRPVADGMMMRYQSKGIDNYASVTKKASK